MPEDPEEETVLNPPDEDDSPVDIILDPNGESEVEYKYCTRYDIDASAEKSSIVDCPILKALFEEKQKEYIVAPGCKAFNLHVLLKLGLESYQIEPENCIYPAGHSTPLTPSSVCY